MVNGYEFDDRDERPMAYYSLDYGNIYKPERKNILYVIRAQIGEGTDHKKDISNNWGRASTLPIIHKLDIQVVNEKVDEKYRENINDIDFKK